ncbi:MAG: RNA-binding S4 domain-containing protein [Candidatus Gastranaerophilaceae bacterium]
MRLDKFLKVSRLIKRRTVANDVSDKGRIFVNGNPSKPAKQLKEGDEITIVYAGGETTVKVVKIPSGNVSVQESSSLYEIIKDFREEKSQKE